MKKITTVAGVMAAGLFTGVLLTTGCGADDSGARQASDSLVAPPATGAAQQATVPQVLRFTGTMLDGEAFDGASLAGKPAVLWSWTPGCAVCQGEAPHMAKVSRQYGDRVAFVGVAGMSDRAAMKKFTKATGVDGFTQLADTDGKLWPRLGFTQQASFLFVRPDGSVERAMGPQGEAKLAQRVAALTV